MYELRLDQRQVEEWWVNNKYKLYNNCTLLIVTFFTINEGLINNFKCSSMKNKSAVCESRYRRQQQMMQL